MPNGRLAKPIENIDEEYILKKMNSNDKKERHYRVVRIPMWNGQLFLSMYYRFLVTNDILFCEARFFLLTPLKKKYLEIKNIPLMPTKREFFEALMQSIFVGAFSWIQVWLNALAFMQGGFMSERARVKQWQREVESNRLYNYGWENSLREKWSSELYERYFQKVDKDVSQKLLTNGFLAGLMDFLSERNICIDQFKQTSSKIINEGVMISGGEVRAETLAVGKGAKIAHTAINTVRGGEKQS